MNLKIEDNCLFTEDGRLVCVFTSEANEDDKKAIVAGAETYESVEKFVNEINSGQFKLRAATVRFEKILNKYS